MSPGFTLKGGSGPGHFKIEMKVSYMLKKIEGENLLIVANGISMANPGSETLLPASDLGN